MVEVGTFNKPIHVAAPPMDKRLFVVEREGRVVVFKEGAAKAEPFLDIRDKVQSGGERGLFTIAFRPDYATSGLAYVHYTDVEGHTRVVEFKVSSDPDKLDPNSARQLIFQEQPFANHNGGGMLFDSHGMLIIGLGDGGSGGDPGNRAQNLGTLLGKLLRIDPRRPSGGKPYGIPTDNPFLNRPGALPEIWAYGLRNPWRFSFDPATKDLWIGDVGQNRFEEIDWVPPASQAGANYGWRKYEGNALFSQNDNIDESKLVRPIVTYGLGGGNCAVTGGYVYRGEVNTLRGFYVYSDYCSGFVKAFQQKDGAPTEEKDLPFNVDEMSSFGEDADGQLYLVSLGGKVFKIVRKT